MLISVPAKAYALGGGLVQRRLDALPVDFQLPRARLARHLDRIAHHDAELGEGEVPEHACGHHWRWDDNRDNAGSGDREGRCQASGGWHEPDGPEARH